MTKIVLLLIVFALRAAVGATVTPPLFSGEGNSTTCQEVGPALRCEYSGWSTSGARVISSDTQTYEYNGVVSLSAFVSLDMQTWNNTNGGAYTQGDLWGSFWGWSINTLHSAITNSSSYADSSGYFYSSVSSGEYLTETRYFSSGWWNCFDPTRCVSEGQWFETVNHSFQESGSWQEYREGIPYASSTWANASPIGGLSWEYSGSWHNTWDSTGQAPTGDVPEPGTYAMIGSGLLGIGLLLKKKK